MEQKRDKVILAAEKALVELEKVIRQNIDHVSYTHLRAHET